jgi:hypothetical protein
MYKKKKILGAIALASSLFIVSGCTTVIAQPYAGGYYGATPYYGPSASIGLVSYSYPYYYGVPYYYYGGLYYYGGHYSNGFYNYGGRRLGYGHYYDRGYRYYNGRRYSAVNGRNGYYSSRGSYLKSSHYRAHKSEYNRGIARARNQQTRQDFGNSAQRQRGDINQARANKNTFQRDTNRNTNFDRSRFQSTRGEPIQRQNSVQRASGGFERSR